MLSNSSDKNYGKGLSDTVEGERSSPVASRWYVYEGAIRVSIA
jgi:hypothetical protein